ncbi:MAG: TonB-dependent receptor [Pseudomonadota bacterium]
MQDIPLSVSAISAVELEQAAVYDLEDLAEITPGLTYQNLGAFGVPTIRGLAQTDTGGIQANVGVFVDGVFLNNRSSFDFGVLDLDRIEVVKGPQSALYGRNTFAGAINYVSRAPSFDELEGRVSAEFGNEERMELRGSVNVPLSDSAAIRFFGATSEFDGTIENSRGGDNLGGFGERTSYGASLLFDATERLRIKLFAVRTESEEDQPPLITIPFARNDCGAQYDLPAGTFYTLYCGGLQSGDAPNLNSLGEGKVGELTVGYLTVDYDFDFATLSATYAKTESEYRAAFDNTSNPALAAVPFFGGPWSLQFFTNSSGDVAEEESFQIRLASDNETGFNWSVGAAVFDSQSGVVLSTIASLVADPNTLERITRVTESLDTDINAIFGTLSYEFGKHKVTAEARYSEETQYQVNDTIIDFLPILNGSTAGETEFDYTNPRFTYEYQYDTDTLVYGSVARGLKTGGINGAGFVGTPFEDFDPETNWTYEFGIKTTILDGRGTFNAAAFFIDWEDLQLPAPPSLQAGSATVNAAGASSAGIEIDSAIGVTDNFVIRGAITYIQPEFDSGVFDATVATLCGQGATPPPVAPTVTCNPVVGGNQLAGTSDLQIYLGGTYTWPQLIGELDGYFRVDTSHQAGKYSTSLNILDQGDINLTNVRLGLQSERYEIALWAQNLFDEEYNANVVNVTSQGAFGVCNGCGINDVRVYPGNGISYGLRGSVNF